MLVIKLSELLKKICPLPEYNDIVHLHGKFSIKRTYLLIHLPCNRVNDNCLPLPTLKCLVGSQTTYLPFCIL